MRIGILWILSLILTTGCDKKKQDCTTSDSSTNLVADGESTDCPTSTDNTTTDSITSSQGSLPNAPPPASTTPDSESASTTEILSVESVSPSYGITLGGTTITISGKSFAQGATVKIGSLACSNVVISSSTTIQCVTPVNAAGIVDVIVDSGSQSATLTKAYQFKTPAVVTADIASKDFGLMPTSYAYTSDIITFTNNGEMPATNVSGSNLAVFGYVTTGTFPGYVNPSDHPCTAVLDAGASCKVNIKFEPASPGVKSENFVFNYLDGAQSRTITIPLTGTGATPGALATDFATNGTILTATSNNYHQIFDMTYDNNYRMVAVGTHMTAGNINEMVIRRYYYNGLLDATFATSGTYTGVPTGCTKAEARRIKSLSTGKYLIAFQCWDAMFNYKLGFVRLNENGTVDASYGSSGYFMNDAGHSSIQFDEAIIHDDGTAHLFGSYTAASYQSVIMKTTAAGALDTTAYTNGIANVTIGTASKPQGIVMDSTGNIYIGADEWISAGVYDAMIVKILANGSGLDTSFGVNGKKIIDLSQNNDRVISLYSTTNGYILAGVRTGNKLGVMAIQSSNGTPATGFGTNGVAVLNLGLANNLEVYPVKIDFSYGSIVVSGYSDNGGQYQSMMVARVTSTGNLDTTFNSVGYKFIQPENTVSAAYAFTYDYYGRYLLGGISDYGSSPGKWAAVMVWE